MKEEKAILKAYEDGEMNVENPTSEALNEIASMSVNTFRKDRRVTIRLYDHDLKGIQKKVLEQGIPYQTLISSMIHRYVEGSLVEKGL